MNEDQEREGKLGLDLFSYFFAETLDKSGKIGGEAFIAKSKEANT